MELTPWIPLISAIAGGTLTGVVAISLNFINKRSEERKQLRNLMFNAAIENWKSSNEYGMRMGDFIINILIGLGAFSIIGGLVKRFILKPDAVEQENIRTKLQNLDMWYDLKRTVVDNKIIPIEDIPSIEKTIAFKIKTQLNKGIPASPKEHLELYYTSMFSVCAMTLV